MLAALKVYAIYSFRVLFFEVTSFYTKLLDMQKCHKKNSMPYYHYVNRLGNLKKVNGLRGFSQFRGFGEFDDVRF